MFNEMIVSDDATDYYYLTSTNYNWYVICIGISIWAFTLMIMNHKGVNFSDCITNQFIDWHVTFSLSLQISLYDELEDSSLWVRWSQ